MSRICRHCGTPIPRETSRFCAGCGRLLGQEDIIVTDNMNAPVQQPISQQPQPQRQTQSWQGQAQQAAQHVQSAMRMLNGIITVSASNVPGEMVVGEFGLDIIGIVTNAAANVARSAGAAAMNTAQQKFRQQPQAQYPQQGQTQQMPPQQNYPDGYR